MLPWNLAYPRVLFGDLELEETSGGCQSRLALVNPPISASDITLHAAICSGLSKEVKT